MKFVVHSAESRGRLVMTRVGGTVTIGLDNPKARNALSINMMQSLKPIIDDLEREPPNIVILRAEDKRFFCAGGDLKDVRNALSVPEAGAEMCRYMTAQLNRLRRLSSFIIVAVDGGAIGGGAELTTVADYILADRRSVLGFVQLRMGVTTGWGGAARLEQKVGRSRATQLLIFSERLTAMEALEYGWVDQVSDVVSQDLEKIVSRLQQLPIHSFQKMMKYRRGQLNEQQAFEQTWASIEHLHALGLSEEGGG